MAGIKELIENIWVGSLYVFVLFAIVIHCDCSLSLLKTQILPSKPRNTLQNKGILMMTKGSLEDGNAKSDLLMLLAHD